MASISSSVMFVIGSSNSVVTREVLEELLMEPGAESSERVIAVLGPRLEQFDRLAVGLQVAPSIRGDRRVRSRVDAAKSLEEVVNAAVPCLDVGGDVTLDLATMRGQLYSAEAAQAAAEKYLHQEIYRRENAEVLAKTALEREILCVELRRSKEAQAQLTKKVEQLNAIVATHNEVYAKLAKRVQAAEDHAQSVSKQLVREQEVFKATVAANTAQCSRLHRLLANSDVADDSASARLRLRNEDLMERVQRLVKANRTLRARVQLKEMDPDVLVLVSEGSLILLVFLSFLVVNSQSIVMSSGLSTGELGWEALGVSDDTRAILRQMYQAVDKSHPDTLIADSLARVAFAEGGTLGETSSAAHASESRKTSPGTSATEVRMDRASRKNTPKPAERKRSREECALDRELESSSRRPRLAADAAGQRAVDCPRDVTSFRGEAANMETSVDLEFSSPAPSASRSNTGLRSSGTFKAKSKSRLSSSSKSSAWSASTQVLSSASGKTTPAPRTPSAACRTLDLSPPSTGSSAAGTRRSSRASAAQSSFKSSLMRELEDADDKDVFGGSSPPLTRPRSNSRPIGIDDDSDDDSESVVESERMTVSGNTVDSRVDNSRSAGSEASAVSRSNIAGHSPAREASASGALAPSDGSRTVPTSREVPVHLEIGSPPVAATRESESSASTALVVRDSSIPAQPSAKTRAVQKSATKTQVKSKKSSQKKKRPRSTRAPSESSVLGVAPSDSLVAARSSTSRPQSRRRQATRPQVDASMSSLPGLDSSSLRPVPIPGPIHGDQPQVRFSKQVISGLGLPCTSAQIEAFADYNNHPWQVVRRQVPPHACLFSTVDFDVYAKVSQRASFDQRLRSYWRSFRGFGDEEDADLGYALWERDHWIPARAVELFFSHAFGVLANINSARFGPEDQARIRRELEAARAKGVVYLADRTKRCDRLRVKLVYKMWRWTVDEDPALADIPPEVLFEPSIPGYPFEYLTWVPKSSAWLSEAAALDELQPWRTGWVGAPAQHPWSADSSRSCSDHVRDFGKLGFRLRGPASPDLAQDASSATPRLATSNDTLVAPSTEDPDHLLFLAQMSAAAELAGEDGGGASEGSWVFFSFEFRG
ncbi:unnamed protein product [Phytophthora lilii]|uniref:Unnamed protein product n=1 Tax=Phytophthora lilii TaxID=2077276 RepID=A0A9W6UCY2_9STRA|nr:unnamed protein product [Phytophthora lilii]